MNFNSQICTTKKQSERLLALGLKTETADMSYVDGAELPIPAPPIYCSIPAWSLHRLLYIIPNEYFTDIDFQDIMQRCIFATSTLYNDLIDLIEALIKEGYIYSEYLK